MLLARGGDGRTIVETLAPAVGLAPFAFVPLVPSTMT